MRRSGIFLLVVLLYLITGISNAQLSLNEVSQGQMAMAKLSSMPLAFTENRGQWNERALFKADAGITTFWFCNNEITYVFTRDNSKPINGGEAMVAGKYNSKYHKQE